MPKTVETVLVNGREYQTTIVKCENCGKEIDAAKMPFLVDQSALTLIHPDGYAEIVHQPNEPNGYFDYYCLDCRVAIPHISEQEITNVQKAVCRREPLLATEKGFGPEPLAVDV